jgi:transcriptional regulator with XRE-family HTH domain
MPPEKLEERAMPPEKLEGRAMPPEKFDDFDGCYDCFHQRIWRGLRPPLDFDERLEDHWCRGTHVPCIDLIDGTLVRQRGLTQQQIADAVGYNRTAIAKLLNHHEGGFELIRRIFTEFGMALPSDHDRRIAGHCGALFYIRKDILRDSGCTRSLDPEQYVALACLFKSAEWRRASRALARAKASGHESLLQRAARRLQRAAEAILLSARADLGPVPADRLPRSVTELQNLMELWGDPYLLYLPEIDANWEYEQ